MVEVSSLTAKFKTGSANESLRDEPKWRHSSDVDQDALRELVESNPHKVPEN